MKICSKRNINTIIHNTHNTNNITNNIINNININLIDRPIAFDKEWDLSGINNDEKLKILLSNYIYTSMLEHILHNDKNLNVILQKDEDLGLVYNNDNEKYILMKSDDILNKTMNKLYKHINDTKEDMKFILANTDLIKTFEVNVRNKLNYYRSKESIKKVVNPMLQNIFDKTHEKAVKSMKNVKKQLLNKDNDIGF